MRGADFLFSGLKTAPVRFSVFVAFADIFLEAAAPFKGEGTVRNCQAKTMFKLPEREAFVLSKILNISDENSPFCARSAMRHLCHLRCRLRKAISNEMPTHHACSYGATEGDHVMLMDVCDVWWGGVVFCKVWLVLFLGFFKVNIIYIMRQKLISKNADG